MMDKEIIFDIQDSVRLKVRIGEITRQQGNTRPVGILVTALTGTAGLTGIIETQETEES